MDVICVLPARLHSTRIPRKLLSRIAGRPLLEWSWKAAKRVHAFDRVLVAADSPEIVECASGFDAEVMLTDVEHRSGTDRVEEVAARIGASDDDILVNFQADEPFVAPDAVAAAVSALGQDGSGDIATIAAPIGGDEEFRSTGVVKVVCATDGSALYFSRSPIPHDRDGSGVQRAGDVRFLRHVGIYGCRRSALRRWAGLPESPLESIERLEQLRALEAGMRIHVTVGPATEPGIDLPADLVRAERILTDAGW
ncbi:MAG: 3-deoxy-manno-octulosonate cytidylyltransferase [Gemmatimonadota bacterium]|nr:3-deoxy-manno-octulosonate cytidylyltransferase [Gemmatimonadota bacterium]